MPKNFIFETAVTIDHEANVMLVDTTVRGIASALRRAGFLETTKPNSRPYLRFRGQADQLRFRKAKGQRTPRGRARNAPREPHRGVKPALERLIGP